DGSADHGRRAGGLSAGARAYGADCGRGSQSRRAGACLRSRTTQAVNFPMRLATALMFGLTCCMAHAEDAGRWRLQYFYDKERATFAISDLKFPSSRHGVAIGAIVEGRSVKPMSAITSDGGANWSLVPIEEPGQSLFFLNDSLGWMLTTKSLWR